MDNLLFTLLQRLETLIGAHANIDATKVAIGRAAPLDVGQLPFVAIFIEEDASVGEFGPENINVIDWDVTVGIELMVDADATVLALEQTYLNLRRDVHNAIMADAPTLSQAFVLMTFPIGAEEPQLSVEGKRKTASYKTLWGVRVRTSITDMSTQ